MTKLQKQLLRKLILIVVGVIFTPIVICLCVYYYNIVLAVIGCIILFILALSVLTAIAVGICEIIKDFMVRGILDEKELQHFESCGYNARFISEEKLELIKKKTKHLWLFDRES